MALRITWWSRDPDDPNDPSYHRLSASLDGVHEPSLWPRRSWSALDTTVVGRPGERGRRQDEFPIAHRVSRDWVLGLAKRITEEGFLAKRAAYPLDPADEDFSENFSEGTMPSSGWQIILFIGDRPDAPKPTAMRAERFISDGHTVGAEEAGIFDDVRRLHAFLWGIADPRGHPVQR